MKILVIGSGGREHALAWSAARTDAVEKVYVAPGNAGTAREAKCQNVDIGVSEFEALVSFVRDNEVDFTIVGPEAPLVDGICDFFLDQGLRCFGPSRKAAQLEGSKTFSKDFLARHGIPTARYQSFTVLEDARDYVRSQGAPIVIKADGLAAGKGVVVARSESEALEALELMLGEGSLGAAGHRVVVEEFLDGEEASFICLCDGSTALPFASSQDHKARDDGDGGPNTGGMGAYSPAPVVSPDVYARVMEEVIEPTIKGMTADGAPYVGFLYAGLMIMPDGQPKVIEFNCRFGDPEAQPVLMRLRSDLIDLCSDALDGRLAGRSLEWDERVALGVVIAAGGYPESYEKGDVIEGLDQADGPEVKTFHAGTRESDGQVVTNGGRVLCVVGLGDNVASAQKKAYQGVAAIHWRDHYFRTDIGYRAIDRS
jgi:phosphoribosylamine--glycine ligase